MAGGSAFVEVPSEHRTPHVVCAARTRVVDRAALELLAVAARDRDLARGRSPGEQPSPSYFARIAPVTCRFTLIHSRSSGRPSFDRKAPPLIEA